MAVVPWQPRGDVVDLDTGSWRPFERAVGWNLQDESGIEVGDDVVAGRGERLERCSAGERGSASRGAEFRRGRRDRVVA